MKFSDVDVPHGKTSTERGQKHFQAHKAEIYQRKAKDRHDLSRWQTNAKYLSREFVAWDGEGVTDDDGSHRYVMLAVKSSGGYGDYLGDAKGLGTARIFDFVLAAAEANPGAINVIFGGGYDFNMWFRDIRKADVEYIVNHKFGTWNGYRIGWRQQKSFYLCRVDEDGNKVGKGVTIYDCVSFFQCSFVKACDAWLGERFYQRDMIVEQKLLRSGFTDADIPSVRTYNDAELVNLLALMSELRERLNKVGLRPRRWDGPGAVAAALLLREGVKGHMGTPPDDVSMAARFAYAGGRFELVRFGHVDAPAYEYDINSAYPAAMTLLPDLGTGHWEHVQGDPGNLPYALYHVSYLGSNPDLPGPFYYRDVKGSICYPLAVTNWVWSPEVEVGRKYCETVEGASMTVTEAWVYHTTSDVKPFAFVEGLYNKRRALKLAGDSAHTAIKIGINSMYGKTAQQIGWECKADGTLRIPPFHQLEWAGFTTSWCRARVLEACLSNLGAVVAFETDAVFTSEPLPVKVGTGLGEWEYTEFSSLTYVSSGMYFATPLEGDEVIKSRGVDKGNLSREQVLTALGKWMGRVTGKDREKWEGNAREVTVTLDRFIGAKLALKQDWGKWRRWETVTKHLSVEPTGKREHQFCQFDHPRASDPLYWEMCKAQGTWPKEPLITFQKWHTTFCGITDGGHSNEFPIEWINPDPEMEVYRELREGVTDYE